MPCNTIQQSKVEFLAASTDLDLLAEALRSKGFGVSKTFTGLVYDNGYFRGFYNAGKGRIELPASMTVDEIKQAYSRQVIESQARKFGWQLQWSVNAEGRELATVRRKS